MGFHDRFIGGRMSGFGKVKATTITPVPYDVKTIEDGITHWRMRGAAYYNGYVYIGYVTGAENNADVYVTRINESTGDVDTPVLVKAGIATAEPEDHVSPSLIVLKNQGGANDGRIVVAFEDNIGGADGTTIYLSDSAEDISSWTEILAANNHSDYIYPNLYENTSGHIYVFNRNSGGPAKELNYRVSTDRGSSWGSITQLTDFSSYPQIAFSGNQVHVVINRRDEGTKDILDLYHFYSDDGGATWKDTAGSTITAPISTSEATTVYTPPVGEESRNSDIIIDASNNPYILLIDDWRNAGENNLAYAYYSEGTWNIEIIAVNAQMANGAFVNMAHGCFDPTDPGNAIFHGESVGGFSEIKRYVRTGADTWVEDSVLTGAGIFAADLAEGDNRSPVYVQDCPVDSNIRIMFCYVEGWTSANRMGTFSQVRIPFGDLP